MSFIEFPKPKESHGTTSVDLFFPRLEKYTAEPYAPYQYTQHVTKSGEIQDIEFFFKLSRENFSFLKKSLKGQRNKGTKKG